MHRFVQGSYISTNVTRSFLTTDINAHYEERSRTDVWSAYSAARQNDCVLHRKASAFVVIIVTSRDLPYCLKEQNNYH